MEQPHASENAVKTDVIPQDAAAEAAAETKAAPETAQTPEKAAASTKASKPAKPAGSVKPVKKVKAAPSADEAEKPAKVKKAKAAPSADEAEKPAKVKKAKAKEAASVSADAEDEFEETPKPRLSKREKREKRARREKRRHIWRIVGRFFLYIFTVLIILVGGLLAIMNIIFKGPSQTAGDRLTLTLLETSAAKFVPYIYYTDEEVEAIKERNKVVELEQETDTSLIVINEPLTNELNGVEAPVEEEELVVEEITGATYHGWMMIVKDPSRVILGVCSENFSDSRGGLKLAELAEKYDGVAAINGGAFSDHNGQGNGGTPNGLTVSEGKILHTYLGDFVTAGFDENNVLIVGKMTRAQAEAKKLRDAASFGPALIVNGEPAVVSGLGSGLNPRTAIGQRADGAVLMLVIDGRQVNSPGASYADLVDVMVRYGAVNACNLDGGSSSNIYYEGEILNDGVAITGSRRIPTAFVVR